jgi:hypothetical protein
MAEKKSKTGPYVVAAAAVALGAYLLWPRDASAAKKKPGDPRDPADPADPVVDDNFDRPPAPTNVPGRGGRGTALSDYRGMDLVEFPPLVFGDLPAGWSTLEVLAHAHVDPRRGLLIAPDCSYVIVGQGWFCGWAWDQPHPEDRNPEVPQGFTCFVEDNTNTYVKALKAAVDKGAGAAASYLYYWSVDRDLGLVEGIDKLLEEIDAVCYKEAEESDPEHPLRLFRTWLFGSASLWYDDDTIEFTP